MDACPHEAASLPFLSLVDDFPHLLRRFTQGRSLFLIQRQLNRSLNTVAR